MSEVSDFVDDHQGEERPELMKLNKGQRKLFLRLLSSGTRSPEERERVRAQREDAHRSIPITLPRLKFMDGE